jgi:hypothetical protein
MSMELAVVGGLIGAGIISFIFAYLLDNEQFGYLKTIVKYIGFLSGVVAIQAASGFLRIKFTATAEPIYKSMADSLDVYYSVYLIAIEFSIAYMAIVLIWNLVMTIWMRWFGTDEEKAKINQRI